MNNIMEIDCVNELLDKYSAKLQQMHQNNEIIDSITQNKLDKLIKLKQLSNEEIFKESLKTNFTELLNLFCAKSENSNKNFVIVKQACLYDIKLLKLIKFNLQKISYKNNLEIAKIIKTKYINSVYVNFLLKIRYCHCVEILLELENEKYIIDFFDNYKLPHLWHFCTLFLDKNHCKLFERYHNYKLSLLNHKYFDDKPDYLQKIGEKMISKIKISQVDLIHQCNFFVKYMTNTNFKIKIDLVKDKIDNIINYMLEYRKTDLLIELIKENYINITNNTFYKMVSVSLGIRSSFPKLYPFFKLVLNDTNCDVNYQNETTKNTVYHEVVKIFGLQRTKELKFNILLKKYNFNFELKNNKGEQYPF